MNGWLEAWFPGGSGLTWQDYVLFALCAGALIALGRRAARGVDSLSGYCRGGGRVPWAVAGLGLVSAEVSAITVVGVPAAAFRDDWRLLQLFAGAAAARALVALAFAPALLRGEHETVYGWLGGRFGPATRASAAGAFVLARVLLSAVRLLAACAAAGALLGCGPWPALALFTAVGAAALWRGGIVSAAWTGAFQTGVILSAGLLCAVFLLRRTDGGLPAALGLAALAGKTRALDLGGFPWEPGWLERFFNDGGVFWGAALTGFFGSAAAFAADQELAQKLLCVEDAAAARKAMFLSIAGSFAVLFVHLIVGTLLFVFYKQNPGMALPASMDRIYPHFVSTASRPWLRGLVLCAIFLSSVDAPLASLSATFTADLVRPLRRAAATDDEELSCARASALGFALLLAAVAFGAGSSDAVLQAGLKAGAAAAGPLLGVFALGLLDRRPDDRSAAGALIAMTALDALLLLLSERGVLPFGWSWLAVIGTLGTAGLGLFLARPRRTRAS